MDWPFMTGQPVDLVACPTCKAPTGSPCVHVWPTGVDPDDPGPLTARLQARVDKVGRLTKRPHNTRLALATDYYQRLVNDRAGRPQDSNQPKDRRAMIRAEVEFDRREWRRLRIWLYEFGGIFNPTVNH